MKNLLGLVFSAISAMLLVGCGASGGTTCSGDYGGYSSGCVGGGGIEACVSSSSAWYEVGGQTFTCSSQYNCYSAAEAAVDACYYGKTTTDEVTGLTVDLIMEKMNSVEMQVEVNAAYQD